MNALAILGLVVAGLGFVVFGALWVLTELGDHRNLRTVRRLQEWARVAIAAVFLAVPAAAMQGIDMYADWQTNRMRDQIEDMQERMRDRQERINTERGQFEP